MVGTGNYYRDTQKWPAGPHLFIAVGSPNPEWDGIWRGTPLNLQGVHAGECNRHKIGIEVVGNFDKVPWSAQLEDVVLTVVVGLLRWEGTKDESQVCGHRECHSPKTCPGKAIDMNVVRQKIKQRLGA